MSKTLQDRYATSPLFGGNAPYIEGLYEQYLEDPASVEPALKAWFDGIANGGRETPRGPVEREFAARAQQPRAAQAAGAVPEAILDKQAAVLRLIEAYRLRGHRLAKLDPHILDRLTAAEGLERYLHTKYVGQKRFSLEGGESFIASMDEVVQRAGERGVQEIVIGMAHRGRLNVLVNTLGKMPKDLFAEFDHTARDLPSGDVKYHQGFSAT
jgi:2-oxoglutarate dehydrogenase complex dehydrogenase (E1) component-like enzyme